ncbi:MAG: c-type cytochrome [Granulosicoccus sp.]
MLMPLTCGVVSNTNKAGKNVALLVMLFSVCFATSVRADAEAGKAVFNQCAGCHAVGPGAGHRFGPQLNGVFSRAAGSASGFDYSAAFASKFNDGQAWEASSLDAYLEAPMSNIPGTKMLYPGLKSEDDRRNVIAYLAGINLDGSIAGAESVSDVQAGKKVKVSEEARPLARDVQLPEHGVLHLGRVALEEEIVAWDIDIRPDGVGLPGGEGSVEVGGELYDVQCASCHGVFGEGEGRWPILAGGQDTLTEERPEKTIGSYWPYLSTVFDYVRRAMPFGNARSLSDDDVYAITAYLMYLNDLVDESYVLSADNFLDVKMPNEQNFIADNRSVETWFESAEEPCMSDCIEGEAKVSQRARILDVTPETEDDEQGGVLD